MVENGGFQEEISDFIPHGYVFALRERGQSLIRWIYEILKVNNIAC
jgi:hypothetical protein